MTTTESAGGPVAVRTAERALAGARAPAAVRAERRAWLILWLAFATFCALMFAAFKFAVDYVSTAEVDQGATVTASRGQPVVSLPGSTEKTLLGSRPDLGVGTVLWLDRSTPASADLQLFDDSKIKLLGGSTLELTRMEVGRFITQQAVLLTQSSGPVRYATGGPVDVRVPNAVLHLAPRGDYTVWLDGDLTRVLVYAGEAHVSQPGTSVGLSVGEGRRVDIDSRGQVSAPTDLAMPLLTNSNFAQHDQDWQAHDVPNSPLDVNGARFWVAGPDTNSAALRVFRQSVKAEHGETGLVQKLDRDVSGFRHLWLQAWVRVDYADLSGGGTLGYEYPMMFQVKYEGPVQGSFIPWTNGLYYTNPDNRPVLPGVAVLWPQGEWKLYRVDLMDTDPTNVPYRLLEFAVMGQGHSYDARVAEISLVGE
ncbi:MAG TPA: hypothetical protein VF937_17010 [Chloroflexota bacterium]